MGRHYDVSSDGARFLMLKDVGELMPEPPRIVVVRDWLEELKRLMPTK